MSKPRTKKSSDENARVKVGKLSQQDRELKTGVPRNIRGGGGLSGGVIGDKGNAICITLGR